MYISLISILYRNQRASVNHSSEFSVQRGVKQGDTLSAILFNYVLDIAVEELRISLHEEGLFIAHGLPRLTNTRYAGDIFIYAKSLDELTSMTEGLMESLQQINYS